MPLSTPPANPPPQVTFHDRLEPDHLVLLQRVHDHLLPPTEPRRRRDGWYGAGQPPHRTSLSGRGGLLLRPCRPVSRTGHRQPRLALARGHADVLDNDAPAPGQKMRRPISRVTLRPVSPPPEVLLQNSLHRHGRMLRQGINQQLLPPSEAPGQTATPYLGGRYRQNKQPSASE